MPEHLTMQTYVWNSVVLSDHYLCSWVAVYPNVPAHKPKHPFQPVVHLVAMTVCALLVQEYFVVYSIRLWLVASHIICDIENADKKRKQLTHNVKQ